MLASGFVVFLFWVLIEKGKDKGTNDTVNLTPLTRLVYIHEATLTIYMAAPRRKHT
jgi:hypothetical protein